MLGWIVAPPKETLAEQRQHPISSETTVAITVSSLLSAALAESVLVSSSGQEVTLLFFAYLLVFLFLVTLYHQISRLFADETPAAGAWFRAGAIVILPAHLLLPAAFVCRPFGLPGLMLYAFAKLAVLMLMIRRGYWAAHSLLGWPVWASVLLMASPLLLGLVGIIVATSLMLFVVSVVMIASLS